MVVGGGGGLQALLLLLRVLNRLQQLLRRPRTLTQLLYCLLDDLEGLQGCLPRILRQKGVVVGSGEWGGRRGGGGGGGVGAAACWRWRRGEGGGSGGEIGGRGEVSGGSGRKVAQPWVTSGEWG